MQSKIVLLVKNEIWLWLLYSVLYYSKAFPKCPRKLIPVCSSRWNLEGKIFQWLDLCRTRMDVKHRRWTHTGKYNRPWSPQRLRRVAAICNVSWIRPLLFKRKLLWNKLTRQLFGGQRLTRTHLIQEHVFYKRHMKHVACESYASLCSYLWPAQRIFHFGHLSDKIAFSII